jgi:hypothetical protein
MPLMTALLAAAAMFGLSPASPAHAAIADPTPPSAETTLTITSHPSKGDSVAEAAALPYIICYIWLTNPTMVPGNRLDSATVEARATTDCVNEDAGGIPWQVAGISHDQYLYFVNAQMDHHPASITGRTTGLGTLVQSYCWYGSWATTNHWVVNFGPGYDTATADAYMISYIPYCDPGTSGGDCVITCPGSDGGGQQAVPSGEPAVLNRT